MAEGARGVLENLKDRETKDYYFNMLSFRGIRSFCTHAFIIAVGFNSCISAPPWHVCVHALLYFLHVAVKSTWSHRLIGVSACWRSRRGEARISQGFVPPHSLTSASPTRQLHPGTRRPQRHESPSLQGTSGSHKSTPTLPRSHAPPTPGSSEALKWQLLEKGGRRERQ